MKRDELLKLLRQLTSGAIPFSKFQEELNILIHDNLVAEFKGYEQSRVREFLWYFNSADENAAPCRTWRQRWAMSSKRVRGEPAYPVEQIAEEAGALETCLSGNESWFQRLSRPFSPFR